MDDEELALFFAAKKENEELKERLLYIEHRYDKLICFMKLLDQFPRFWGKDYKNNIKRWLIRHKEEFPED